MEELPQFERVLELKLQELGIVDTRTEDEKYPAGRPVSAPPLTPPLVRAKKDTDMNGARKFVRKVEQLFRDTPAHRPSLVMRINTDEASLRVTRRPSSSTAKVLPKETLMDRTTLRFATITVADANRATSGPSSCTGRVRHRGA